MLKYVFRRNISEHYQCHNLKLRWIPLTGETIQWILLVESGTHHNGAFSTNIIESLKLVLATAKLLVSGNTGTHYYPLAEFSEFPFHLGENPKCKITFWNHFLCNSSKIHDKSYNWPLNNSCQSLMTYFRISPVFGF